MEPKKSQGPRRAVLVASAAILVAVLVGSAYFLRDESARSVGASSSPATSKLRPLFERCNQEPSLEVVEGLTRITCTSQSHPAFMVYSDADGDRIVRAGLMVPMPGGEQQRAERKLVGLELFSLMAGVDAETFLPAELVADIGIRETRFTREGWEYATQPMANVGLVFTVLPASEAAESRN
jgi:hypothetical protein